MKQSRLAAAALSMAILLSGCSTGYASMEASAGSTERIERETPAVQTSRKETLVSKAAAESYQPADETVYVTGDRVNLRRQGSSDSPVIGRVNKGTVEQGRIPGPGLLHFQSVPFGKQTGRDKTDRTGRSGK